MTSEALKPCPFCGGKEVRVQQNGLPRNRFWECVCDDCDFCGPAVDTKDEAVEHWNRRAQLDKAREVGQRAWQGEEGCRWFFFFGWAWLVVEHKGEWRFHLSKKQGPIINPVSVHKTEREAIAAANADFERRILSALIEREEG